MAKPSRFSCGSGGFPSRVVPDPSTAARSGAACDGNPPEPHHLRNAHPPNVTGVPSTPPQRGPPIRLAGSGAAPQETHATQGRRPQGNHPQGRGSQGDHPQRPPPASRPPNLTTTPRRTPNGPSKTFPHPGQPA